METYWCAPEHTKRLTRWREVDDLQMDGMDRVVEAFPIVTVARRDNPQDVEAWAGKVVGYIGGAASTSSRIF
jgi:hypothetical protein